MTALEYARTAWHEIRAHKTRSAMTCFSLAVGVAALLFTFSQAGGTMKRYKDALALAGPGRLQINYKSRYTAKHISRGLTSDDADAIREQWPELTMVSPVVTRGVSDFQLDDYSKHYLTVEGVNDEWRRRDWVYRVQGRMLNAYDLQNAARVCVLIQGGRWIHKPWWARYWPEQGLTKYLEHHDVLGRQVRLNGHLLTIVGILHEPPKDLDPRWFHNNWGDGLAVVPITTFQSDLAQGGRVRESVDSIQVDTGEAATATLYQRRIEGLLATRHREPDFEVRDYREIMEGALGEIRRFILSILVIGIVAVLASGIGIMNVTLATIFSRVREIGIRRALGARRVDIIAQFVFEATALGFVGGVTGVVLGSILVVAMAPRAERMAPIGPVYVGASLLIALATGFLFSLYPAYKASRFDPIEALRYE